LRPGTAASVKAEHVEAQLLPELFNRVAPGRIRWCVQEFDPLLLCNSQDVRVVVHGPVVPDEHQAYAGSVVATDVPQELAELLDPDHGTGLREHGAVGDVERAYHSTARVGSRSVGGGRLGLASTPARSVGAPFMGQAVEARLVRVEDSQLLGIFERSRPDGADRGELALVFWIRAGQVDAAALPGDAPGSQSPPYTGVCPQRGEFGAMLPCLGKSPGSGAAVGGGRAAEAIEYRLTRGVLRGKKARGMPGVE